MRKTKIDCNKNSKSCTHNQNKLWMNNFDFQYFHADAMCQQIYGLWNSRYLSNKKYIPGINPVYRSYNQRSHLISRKIRKVQQGRLYLPFLPISHRNHIYVIWFEFLKMYCIAFIAFRVSQARYFINHIRLVIWRCREIGWIWGVPIFEWNFKWYSLVWFIKRLELKGFIYQLVEKVVVFCYKAVSEHRIFRVVELIVGRFIINFRTQ